MFTKEFINWLSFNSFLDLKTKQFAEPVKELTMKFAFN